jgi:hypothetical protein
MKRHSGRRKQKPGGRSQKAGGRRPRRIAEAAGAAQIEAIRKQIAQVAAKRPPRWNADPEDVKRSVLKLVLTLVELIRQLLERQAIRRMENGTLTDEETESVGLALLRLQETILDLAKQFDIPPDELNLDLGPIGKLL